MDDLPWAVWPWQRCKAVKEPTQSWYHGRCELKKYHTGYAHALDRGMVILRWDENCRWTEQS